MNWLRSQFRTFEKLHAWWRENVTVGGKTLAILSLICIPEWATPGSPLFLLCSAQLSLLLVAGTIGYWFRPRLAIRVLAPTAVRRGRTVDLIVWVGNQSSRPVHDLTLELADAPSRWIADRTRATIARLAGGETVKLSMSVRPTRRGRYALPGVRAASSFPLNLFSISTTRSVGGHLIVLPDYRPLASLESTSTTSAGYGRNCHDAAVPGHGDDYIGSREYVPGMPVRRWDYGCWARFGQPVVREFDDPRHPAVAILVDTCLDRRVASIDADASRETDDPELEAVVSLAAALGEALEARNQQVVLLATGGRIHDLSRFGPADRHAALLRSLATATPSPEDGIVELRRALGDAHFMAETAYVLLRGWDDDRSALCDEISRRGCELIRVFVDGPARDRVPSIPGVVFTTVEEIQGGRVRIA